MTKSKNKENGNKVAIVQKEKETISVVVEQQTPTTLTPKSIELKDNNNITIKEVEQEKKIEILNVPEKVIETKLEVPEKEEKESLKIIESTEQQQVKEEKEKEEVEVKPTTIIIEEKPITITTIMEVDSSSSSSSSKDSLKETLKSEKEKEKELKEKEKEDKKARFRRTDSIAKYKAKQLQDALKKKIERSENGEDSSDDAYTDSSSSDESDEVGGGKKKNFFKLGNGNGNGNGVDQESMQAINFSSSPVTPPLDANSLSQTIGTIKIITPTPFDSTMVSRKRRDSVDSNDPEFGYEDDPVYTTISRRNPDDDYVRPITNPIPGRPVFQVDPSNDIVNLAFIALRTSIRVGNDDIDSITQDQFELIKKYKISISEKRTTIKDFSPNVYHNLRDRLNIYQTDFLKSWSSFISIEAHKSNNSFFLYSSDKKYILKTISKSDSVKLRKVLPHYYNYLVYNPNSLLVKYLGLFRVERKSNQNIYVVLLLNIFNSCCNVDEALYINNEHEKKSHTQRKIILEQPVKQTIYRQIEKDTTFLSSHELMDYSLLVGINRLNSKNEEIPVEKEPTFLQSTAPVSPRLSGSLLHTPPPLRGSRGSKEFQHQLQLQQLQQLQQQQQQQQLSSSQTSQTSPSILLPPSPIVIEAVTISSSPSSLASSSSNVTPPPTPSPLEMVDMTGSPQQVIDPIKSIPRLLFFIEEVENIRKSKNMKIGRSLKKSFAVLPRSWSLQDLIEGSDQHPQDTANNNANNNTSGGSSPTLTHKKPEIVMVSQLSTSVPTSPTILSNSLPNIPHYPHLVQHKSIQQQIIHNQLQQQQSASVSPSTSSTSINGLLVQQQSLNHSSSSLSSSSGSLTPPRKGKNGFVSDQKANEVYYFGVVDFLTKYDSKKKSLKSTLKPSLASSNPSSYLKKFLNNARELLNVPATSNPTPTSSPLSSSTPSITTTTPKEQPSTSSNTKSPSSNNTTISSTNSSSKSSLF